MWLDCPDENFGWILVHGDERGSSTAKRFGSREAPDAALRPRLRVRYALVQYPVLSSNLEPSSPSPATRRRSAQLAQLLRATLDQLWTRAARAALQRLESLWLPMRATPQSDVLEGVTW